MLQRTILPLLVCVFIAGVAHATDTSPFLVSDFESARDLDRVKARTTTVTKVEAGDGGHALLWRVPGTGETCGISIAGVPRDVTGCRFLGLRFRSAGTALDTVHIRLRAGEAVLSYPLPDPTSDWQSIEIAIPDMKTLGGIFNPEAVDDIRLVVFGARGTELLIDDVRLLSAEGGWRWTAQEKTVRVFGEKRAKKVKSIESEHFVVFSDSSAAGRKFPKGLETIHDFVVAELGLTVPAGRIPAYVFQNANLYHDFCVRNGWSRERATATAGHASGEYFSTYYQSTRAPVLVHEMAHSLFHRAVGAGGGSWFQEGAAVYAETRWQKRSPAADFASRLRSGQHVPLRDFIACEKLIALNDRRGGARTAAAAYAQAGAFFEYLLRGPVAERCPGAMGKLAAIHAKGEARVAAIEAALGKSVEDLEAEWRAWGKRPPKLRR